MLPLYVFMHWTGKLVNFQPIVRFNDLYLILIGLVAFITQCRLLHLLRYNKSIAILGATLSNSGKALLAFTICFCIFFTAFASGAYLLFYELVDYASVGFCFSTLAQAFLGKFNFNSLVSIYGTGQGCYLLLYLFLMIIIIIIMNFFRAILNDYLKLVANTAALQNKDFVIIDHFFVTIKAFFVGKSEGEQ